MGLFNNRARIEWTAGSEMARREMARRKFLLSGSHGFGAMALWHLLAGDRAVAGPAPHHPAKAKRVIFIFMMGGPSHLDLFDPKPKMAALHGEPIPESLVKAKKSATGGILETVMASPRKFAAAGECGMELSELLPHTAKMADEITLIRSLHCDQSNHDPAQLLMHSGSTLFGNPSMGAWVNYGLGTSARNLPDYAVLLSDDGHGLEGAGSALWGSGFMPSTYRGVELRGSGEPILHLTNPTGVTAATQRARLDVLGDLNRMRREATRDPEIDARIEAYEMAFRMQAAAPELVDLSGETAQTRAMYGLDDEPTREFGKNCLLARRMIERGVRFVHLVHSTWDHHSEIDKRLEDHCRMTDRPSWALVTDLKQRGLLDETLVVWVGEFGRTPMGEVRRGSTAGKEGRDHHPQAFSGWLAGGGVKGGYVHGATDDFGFNVTTDAMHVHDLHATMLHLLGLDHERLTYRHSGRDYRLTDVAGRVVDAIIA